MDIPSRYPLTRAFLAFLIFLIFTVIPVKGAEMRYDENIIVGFDEYFMEQELGPERNVTGDLPIHWYARDPGGTVLFIDLFIGSVEGGEWVPIVENNDNSGTYIWDLEDPSVPDGDHILKVIAHNIDGYYSYNVSSFWFHVHNPKRPDVTLTTNLTGGEFSGKVKIEWDVLDLDHSRYLISSRVSISPDDGLTFQQIFEYPEDPGLCILDTMDLKDGDRYRLRVDVEDPDGLKDLDISGRFYIFNNIRPEVNLTSPPEGAGIFETVRIEWDSFDRNDGRDSLRVDLWYVTVHDGGRYDIQKGAHNSGSYDWNTTDVVKGPQGHRIFIQLIDPVGARSGVDDVLVWIYRMGDPLILNPSYPTGTVTDNITLTWETYKPALVISEELVLMVYHRKPGSVSEEVVGPLHDTGSYSIDVSSGPDGTHHVRMILMDPLRSWIYDELVVGGINVYHEKEPQMLIRGAPANGTNMTGMVVFDVAGFDGNGDILTYMGLCRLKGGEWTVFDVAYGGYRQKLVLNTTDVHPGEYEVRIAVYDRSRYNLSTSRTLGPYYLRDNRTPAMDPLSDDDEKHSPVVIVVIVALSLLLLMIVAVLVFIVRRDRKSQREGKIGTPVFDREHAPPYIMRTQVNTFSRRSLPSIGSSSAGRWGPMENDGGMVSSVDNMAYTDEYLEMLDPDLVDDVTEGDLDSYQILGVGTDASESEIKAAYREFVKRFHPDRFAARETLMFRKAEDEIRKRNRAKAILLDPGKRAVLDRMLRDSEAAIIRKYSVKSLQQLRNLRKGS
ncbi:MAG: DnaJ domain-containing protein [Candidatus Thermoplasmatota archaeon]|nr:DnaJ domain-containing protein [Candidatus Thermoplasmatota archaeon]